MVGNMLLEPLENRKYPLLKNTPQAVVVLGGGKTAKAPNLPLSASATKRLLYGVMLSFKKRLPLIISGCEGEWAKRSLLEINEAFHLGFKPLLKPKGFGYMIEGKSVDTYQNAIFTKKLFQKENPTIILVTSAYHMPRSYRLFRYAGFNVLAKPTDFKEDSDYIWKDFLPSFGGLKKSYIALHEYFGLLSLYLRGFSG